MLTTLEIQFSFCRNLDIFTENVSVEIEKRSEGFDEEFFLSMAFHFIYTIWLDGPNVSSLLRIQHEE